MKKYWTTKMKDDKDYTGLISCHLEDVNFFEVVILNDIDGVICVAKYDYDIGNTFEYHLINGVYAHNHYYEKYIKETIDKYLDKKKKEDLEK